MKTLEELMEDLERQYSEDDFELASEILWTVAEFMRENLNYYSTALALEKAFTRIIGQRKSRFQGTDNNGH